MNWYKNKRVIVLSELIFITGVLFYLFYYSQPKLITPSSGLVVEGFDFNFEIENADRIILSRTMDFMERVIVERGKEATLVPGTYYWKAVSFLGESEVRNFTISTSLVLSLIDQGGMYAIHNKGNVDVNVSDGKSEIIGAGELSVFEKENTTFEGRQA